MERLKKAQIIALVASVLSIIGFILTMNKVGRVADMFLIPGFLLSLVSYLFGGFGKAIKYMLSIAKIPLSIFVLPLNIFFALFSMLLSFVFFVFVPIIPVRGAYRKALKNVEE